MQAPKLEASQEPTNGLDANGNSETGRAPEVAAEEINDSAGQQIEEDPESEFKGAAQYEAGMPRIINVGIDGPGAADTDHVVCWPISEAKMLKELCHEYTCRICT